MLREILARPDCTPLSTKCTAAHFFLFLVSFFLHFMYMLHPSWSPPFSVRPVSAASAFLVSLLNSEGSRFLVTHNHVGLYLSFFLLLPSPSPNLRIKRTILRDQSLCCSFLSLGSQCLEVLDRGASLAASWWVTTGIYRFHVSTISFVQVIFKGKGYFIVLCHLYHCGHGYNGLKMKLYLEALQDWGLLGLRWSL